MILRYCDPAYVKCLVLNPVKSVATESRSHPLNLEKIQNSLHFYPRLGGPIVEVRDSPHGIFDPCAQWARGLARMKNCLHVVVAAVAVSVLWKMAKYEEMHTFAKMDMFQNSTHGNFSEIKGPAGAS